MNGEYENYRERMRDIFNQKQELQKKMIDKVDKHKQDNPTEFNKNNIGGNPSEN